MGWLKHKSNAIAILIITTAFLLGIVEAIFGVGVGDSVAGIPLSAIIAVGQVYILWAFYTRNL